MPNIQPQASPAPGHVGPLRSEKAALPRRCIVTRHRQHRNGMIRFVIGPDDIVVPDLGEKLPGRGFWVAADRQALSKAVKKNVFAAAAKAPVSVLPEMAEMVTGLLRERALNWLGQARRAGALRIGFVQVREALAKGEAGLLAEAADAKENGKSKIMSHAGDLPIVSCFNRAEMGYALGRSQVVHLAIVRGTLCARFLNDAQRYIGVQGLEHPSLGGEQ